VEKERERRRRSQPKSGAIVSQPKEEEKTQENLKKKTQNIKIASI